MGAESAVIGEGLILGHWHRDLSAQIVLLIQESSRDDLFSLLWTLACINTNSISRMWAHGYSVCQLIISQFDSPPPAPCHASRKCSSDALISLGGSRQRRSFSTTDI